MFVSLFRHCKSGISSKKPKPYMKRQGRPKSELISVTKIRWNLEAPKVLGQASLRQRSTKSEDWRLGGGVSVLLLPFEDESDILNI